MPVHSPAMRVLEDFQDPPDFVELLELERIPPVVSR